MFNLEKLDAKQAAIYRAHMEVDSILLTAMAACTREDAERFDVLNHLSGDNVATCEMRLHCTSAPLGYDEIAQTFAETFAHDYPKLDRHIKWLESLYGDARHHVAFRSPFFTEDTEARITGGSNDPS